MTVYQDFGPEEQRLLLASLEAAAVVISASSPGRKEETTSEGFAAASFVLDNRADYVGNTLVSSVILALEERLRSGERFPDYVEVASVPGARESSLGILRSVVELLDATATPEEAAGYKDWLSRIASAAATAGREDQGFLGRGGVQVNDAERAALQEIAAVLGIET